MADKPMDRRRFFRHGLAELLKPLSKVTRPLEEMARQFSDLEKRSQPRPPVEPQRAAYTAPYTPPPSPDDVEDLESFLRPPGARDEQDFLNICSRCGNCVHACPVQAIQLDHSAHRANGAPYIDPTMAACTMCDELACMNQCPSSALMLVPREDIDLGTAVWNEGLCLRHAGDSCTMCVDHCPMGTLALEVLDNRVVVHEDHCTGCGSCQNNCPTHPKSIIVTPKSKRDAGGVV
jgi:MauM/NapG family ferredoxin protein